MLYRLLASISKSDDLNSNAENFVVKEQFALFNDNDGQESTSHSVSVRVLPNNDPAEWNDFEQLIQYFVQKGYFPQNIDFDHKELIKSTLQINGGVQRFISKSFFQTKNAEW